ncbi:MULTISPECIES: hypothetical protein [Brasilonema]|nr:MULTISPECIES: hypothetical protein [Brasilonema]
MTLSSSSVCIYQLEPQSELTLFTVQGLKQSLKNLDLSGVQRENDGRIT